VRRVDVFEVPPEMMTSQQLDQANHWRLMVRRQHSSSVERVNNVRHAALHSQSQQVYQLNGVSVCPPHMNSERHGPCAEIKELVQAQQWPKAAYWMTAYVEIITTNNIILVGYMTLANMS